MWVAPSSIAARWARKLNPIHINNALKANLRGISLSSTTPIGPKNGDTVVIAMSGGVDSSVAAQLLVQKGYNVSAVYMRNWDTRDETGLDDGCEWKQDWEDVQQVCKIIGIPCQLVDLSRHYWNRVFQPALELWESGATPNPDVDCNREIKFGALMDEQVVSSSDWFATGHYAQVHWENTSKHPRPRLSRSVDHLKDQTYYLSEISEKRLRKTLFPIGHLTKAEVRGKAFEYKFPTALRRESMGICFVGQKRRFNKFLAQYIETKPGHVVDLAGRVLGHHNGLWSLTIGEGAKIPGAKCKMFVAEKNHTRNEILVVDSHDHPLLQCRALLVRNWHWIWGEPPVEVNSPDGFRATVQLRHRMTEIPCSVKRMADEQTFHVSLSQSEHGIAAGQIAVIWDGIFCLGGGTIAKTWCQAELQEYSRG